MQSNRFKSQCIMTDGKMKVSSLFVFLFVYLITPGNVCCGKGPFHGQVGTAIERSFGTGNPDYLKQYLPAKGKIYFSLPIANISGGNYSRTQILAMMRQMFKEVITRGFTLEGGMLPNLQRGPIRAQWEFTDRKTDRRVMTTVYFTITSNPLKPIIKSIRGETSIQGS